MGGFLCLCVVEEIDFVCEGSQGSTQLCMEYWRVWIAGTECIMFVALHIFPFPVCLAKFGRVNQS